ncbi:MAG: SpoIVB peptidase S55 domain-containing protein [Candidatus Eisenbacteria bacterium]
MTTIALLFALGLAPTVARIPTLPPTALHAGQTALVRTVFAGDSIETFEARILGVMDGGRSDGTVILAQATSPKAIASGVAQGMSGSPVYVDGKLVGALSSGWGFSREPIFGITPIGEMLDVLDLPEPAPGEAAGGPSGLDDGPSPRCRGLSWEDGDAPVAPLVSPAARVVGRPATLDLPLAAGGLNPRAFAAVQSLFEGSGFAVTPGGRASRPAPAPARPFEPGSACAVDLLRGDLNFSAIGTVTYVDGDRVLIFGHPFFQAGGIRLPLSTAHIVTILPSTNISFKLGVAGTPVGTATQDRRAAVAGRLGPVPALLPFGVTVEHEGRTQRFRFEAVEDRLLFGQLVSAAALNSAMESGGTTPIQTVEWSLTLYRGGRATVMRDVVAGEQPLAEACSQLAAPLRFLYANSFERFSLDSAQVRLRVIPGRRQWTLRSATLLTPRVAPGGTALVRAEIERWRGERRNVTLRVTVPQEFPDGRYALAVSGGAEADRAVATRLPSRFRPVSVADGLEKLANLRTADALYPVLWAHAPQVTREGEDFPELPGSALAVLGEPANAGDQTRLANWAAFTGPTVTVEGMLRGEVLLELNVDHTAPVGAENR